MLKVFLADDEHLIRRGLKKLIPWEELGFEIRGEASDGEEALEQITADNTDIVITDLKMPGMDGLELTEKLKERFPGIKVIVLTGFDDFSYMQQSIRNSVVDYLLKPVNAELLEESLLKIKEQLGKENYGYPFMLESRLLREVEDLDRKSLPDTVEALFEEFRKHKVPFELSRKMCASVLVTLNLRLNGTGCNLEDILKSDVSSERHMARFTTLNEVKKEFERIVFAVLDHKTEHGNQKMIEQIKEYIERNLSGDITLADLAGKFFLNASYLSQLFKTETGENYVDFLTKRRVEKAKRLLEDKNLRIQDICEMVGYNDSKYFGQLFRKQIGLLPSEYRARLANKE
jgi:two-component system response regulator YesN